MVPVGANDEGIRAPVVVQVEAHGGHGRASAQAHATAQAYATTRRSRGCQATADNSGGAVPTALVPSSCVTATKRTAPADNSGGGVPTALVPGGCVTATQRTARGDNSGGAVP